ncbi:MAG: glycosyltransferase [Sulfurovum sp.]|nr:glycosyltransferase [Sulfurovum sp.]
MSTDKYKCDVVFIGHYEDDGRDEAIKLLIDNGIDLKLYGTEWDKSKYYDFFRDRLSEIKPVYNDYNLALNSTKIALVFLSKLNNDTYTRRCFEIPATKTMMMAEYSDDLNTMFSEGKEADYFKTKEELLGKVQYYLAHQDTLTEVSENGYQRLLRDGHEIRNRVKEVISTYEK